MHARNRYLWMIMLTISMIMCMLPRAHSQNRGQVTATADPEVICAGEVSHLHAEATVSSPIIDFETGDFSQFSFNNDQTRPWTVVSADNGSSYCMKSGNSGISSTTSTISAVVVFSTMGTIVFDAKCMGEGASYAYDKCVFSIDGQQQFAYGAQIDGWQNYSFFVSSGSHTFTWSYIKDSSVNPTGDAFFVDNISFNDNVDYSELSINFETGNFSQANFNNSTTGSNKPWIITSSTSAAGSYCMMSGNKGISSSSSVISLTHVFESAGYISFDAKCMGEGSYTYYDQCCFYIDGVKQFEKGANGNSWDNYFYTVSAGSHTFKWEYTKDSSVNPTGDAFYVDNISLVAVNSNSGGGTPSEAYFTWTPGNMHGSDVTVTPSETTTYTVTATDESGTIIGTAEQTVVVYQDPELSISTNTGSANICEGDTIVLYVTVGGLSDVKVGDILCTDGTTVPPSQWPCDKTAQGIVFYVDVTGQHGWAVDLGEITETKKWSTQSQQISGLQIHDNFMDAITDLDGYANTQAIRNAGNAAQYPAAWAVDFGHGWYLPAAGQLNILYGEYFAVNTSLELVGGLLFNNQNNPYLWSSSAAAVNKSWVVFVNNGYFDKHGKNMERSVRAVIDF